MIRKTSTRISRAENISIQDKLSRFNWKLFFMTLVVLSLSLLTLYSAGYNLCENQNECLYSFGSWTPWAYSQLIKILIAVGLFFVVALSNIKFWIKSSYLIWGICFILVLLVSFIGHTGMGAQRWLNIGFFAIQPSEFIKIATVIVLAKYFSWMNQNDILDTKKLIIPSLLVLAPFVLVLKQPDLGTALTLAILGGGMFFISGVAKKWFIIILTSLVVIAPLAWTYGLHDYQKARITTFISPGSDTQGSGYQINQAKIAIGSGGFTGKGYLSGSQSHLNFLPEKQTDFIFTMFGEEFGFAGCLFLLIIYSIMTFIMFRISKITRNRFGQLLGFGIALNFFIYYCLNIAMVIGLIPTVGIPLPLMSFGGSSLLSIMFSLGLIQNIYIHKDVQLGSSGV